MAEFEQEDGTTREELVQRVALMEDDDCGGTAIHCALRVDVCAVGTDVLCGDCVDGVPAVYGLGVAGVHRRMQRGVRRGADAATARWRKDR